MLEHNRDRGKIKWTALMLPEHITKLREWQAEDNHVKRPELSEWDLEVINEELVRAQQRNCQTLIKTWKEGIILSFQGTLERLDMQKQIVFLEDPFGMVHISAQEIISVQHMD